MNQTNYHDTRRTIHRLVVEANLLRGYANRHGMRATDAERHEARAAELRRSISARTDHYWLIRNARAASLNRSLREAVARKAQRARAAVEVAKLVPTGDGFMDALNRISVEWGGQSAASVQQAMAAAA